MNQIVSSNTTYFYRFREFYARDMAPKILMRDNKLLEIKLPKKRVLFR